MIGGFKLNKQINNSKKMYNKALITTVILS